MERTDRSSILFRFDVFSGFQSDTYDVMLNKESTFYAQTVAVRVHYIKLKTRVEFGVHLRIRILVCVIKRKILVNLCTIQKARQTT